MLGYISKLLKLTDHTIFLERVERYSTVIHVPESVVIPVQPLRKEAKSGFPWRGYKVIGSILTPRAYNEWIRHKRLQSMLQFKLIVPRGANFPPINLCYHDIGKLGGTYTTHTVII